MREGFNLYQCNIFLSLLMFDNSVETDYSMSDAADALGQTLNSLKHPMYLSLGDKLWDVFCKYLGRKLHIKIISNEINDKKNKIQTWCLTP